MYIASWLRKPIQAFANEIKDLCAYRFRSGQAFLVHDETVESSASARQPIEPERFFRCDKKTQGGIAH